jgi:hypothetical protein
MSKDYLKETLDLGRDDFKVDVKEGFSLTQILSTDKVMEVLNNVQKDVVSMLKFLKMMVVAEDVITTEEVLVVVVLVAEEVLLQEEKAVCTKKRRFRR